MDTTTLDTPRHELHVLDQTGDTKIIWDPSRPEEVAHARQTFNDFKAKRYLAYRVTPKGDQGEVLREFDATADKMILAPQTIGG